MRETNNYNDVLMRAMASQIAGVSTEGNCLLNVPFVQTQIKENIKAPCDWHLWREFTGDQWIPRTKGQ